MEKRFYHLIIMNCTLINIIWIERGILYTIIYYYILLYMIAFYTKKRNHIGLFTYKTVYNRTITDNIRI